MIAALKPSLVIPMHYKIPELGKDMKDLGPIDPWLSDRENVVRLATNTYQLSAGQEEARRILVFRPSPLVESWHPNLKRSWGDARKGYDALRAGKAKEAEKYFRVATRRAPQVVGFWAGLSSALQAQGHSENALRILQTGLLASEVDDWEHTLTARLFLGNLYAQRKLPQAARRQARIVLLNSHRTPLLDQARLLLDRLQESSGAQ